MSFRKMDITRTQEIQWSRDDANARLYSGFNDAGRKNDRLRTNFRRDAHLISLRNSGQNKYERLLDIEKLDSES